MDGNSFIAGFFGCLALMGVCIALIVLGSYNAEYRYCKYAKIEGECPDKPWEKR